MPKVNIDYSKCVIYKIVCNDLNVKDLYVGSTTNFIKRKQQHKISCNNENSRKYNYNIYSMIREKGNWNNWTMIEIEKYPCNDGNEALARERYWLETLNATLNMVIPTRTRKEYYEDNRDDILEYHIKYYEDNIDKIKEYKANYRAKNKDILKEINKEYHEKNKEKYSIKKKEYSENHKDELKEYRRIKIECECGVVYTKINKPRHEKGSFHTNFLKSQELTTV